MKATFVRFLTVNMAALTVLVIWKLGFVCLILNHLVVLNTTIQFNYVILLTFLFIIKIIIKILLLINLHFFMFQFIPFYWHTYYIQFTLIWNYLDFYHAIIIYIYLEVSFNVPTTFTTAKNLKLCSLIWENLPQYNQDWLLFRIQIKYFFANHLSF